MSSFRCAVLAGISTLALPGVAFADPAMDVIHPFGPPTSKVSVYATGFGAGNTVDFFFDSTDLCQAVSDNSSAFCEITVPTNAQPGPHRIIGKSGALSAQQSFLVRTDMPQFHGLNALHQGINPFENTINTGNVGNLKVLWHQAIASGVLGGSPVVAYGHVYVASLDGKLYAFNATTGTPIAGFPAVAAGGHFSHSTPAVGNENVYIGSGNQNLYAFNAHTGATIPGFPKTLGSVITSSPTLALGNVYVGCLDGNLYAFNAATGVAVSGFPVSIGNGVDYAAPTVFNGNVYIISEQDKLYGFNARTGATLTGFPVATSQSNSTMAEAFSKFYFGSFDNKLYSVTAASGASTSGFPFLTGGIVGGSPAVYSGSAIVGSADGKLYAVQLSNGAKKYAVTVEAGAGGRSSPMIANGVTYFAETAKLYALSAANGSRLWSAAISNSDNNEYNSPVVANGIVYYADDTGNLTAYSVNGVAPEERFR